MERLWVPDSRYRGFRDDKSARHAAEARTESGIERSRASLRNKAMAVSRWASGFALAAALAACGPGEKAEHEPTATPSVPAPDVALVFHRDDLATAGLGIEGLRGAAPTPDQPLQATAEQLWRLAVHTNYRALVDVTEAGGFGRLYGPKPDELPIPGTEHWALGEVPGGGTHVMLLQVPDAFPGERPCLVAAPASGSRGPLGAIGTVGDWALRHDCAVVYTDKGAGPWVANLGDGKAYDITGVRGEARQLALVEPFSRRSWPENDDVAFKHAHSGHNPEAHWGEMTLNSIRFALARLNHRQRAEGQAVFSGDGIQVIAASISNGGASVLRAAELDTEGLIDGVVASEPNVYVPAEEIAVREGDDKYRFKPRPLFDYATTAAIHGPCAVLSDRFNDAPMAANRATLSVLLEGRCRGLAAAGLVAGEDTQTQSEAAYRAMLEHGLHPAATDAQVANTMVNIWALIGAVYANAYGRFEPPERLCGIAFHAFDADNQPVPVDTAQAALIFGTSSGVPPVAGVDLAAVGEQGSLTRLMFAPSKAAGGPAFGLDQAQCLRELWSGDSEAARRVRDGVAATAATGDLNGKPALLLHGRADALVWVNHSSRAYFAANRRREGPDSRLRYLEVTNAQHFDALLAFPSFSERFVPLHLYFERALDAMYAHLTDGAELPPSQVVRTIPRNAGAALADGNVPLFDHAPERSESIKWQDNTLHIPR